MKVSNSKQEEEELIYKPKKKKKKNGGANKLGNDDVVVEEDVHGVIAGRIVRSTGRKDRHSKVCTTRGPRDRRVRLSPHTAIQFYDVQDRLGYDRPSKAIDWLMKEAKSAIDALDDSISAQLNSTNLLQSAANHHHHHHHFEAETSQEYNMNDISNYSSFSFFSMLNAQPPPPPPAAAAAEQGNNNNNSNRSQAQGICFSFQDLPFLLGSGGQQQVLLPPPPPPPPIPILQQAEMNPRIPNWNANSSNSVFPLHCPYQQQQQQQQQQLPPYYQREPLQSSLTPSFQLPNSNYAYLRYSNNDGGLLELSRLQGEEEQNQIPSKPSIMHFHS